MKAMKLFTNGKFEVVELPVFEHKVVSMREELNCDLVEIVQAKYLDEDYCIICDEEFLLKGNPKINPVASYLYGMQDHGQILCGDVLIMKNRFSEDGIETVGLDDKDSAYLKSLIRKHYKDSIVATIKFLDMALQQKSSDNQS